MLGNDNILHGCGINITSSDDDLYSDMESITHTLVNNFNCGGGHLGFITKYPNNSFMKGYNKYFQCGLKSNDYYCNEFKLDINNENITNINCGWNHTIIKTINNNYYSFGRNKYNSLLLNSHNNRCLPTLISIKYIQNLIKSEGNIVDLVPAKNKTFILIESRNL
mmetsp:Transcript_42161/g.51888  ORF Transcript_42161/g.51888 Transcript_42161/m.51888 type:complete len:165 (-) Transcript_42161:76-570(-)